MTPTGSIRRPPRRVWSRCWMNPWVAWPTGPCVGSTSTTCGFGRLEEVHGLATGAEDAGGVGGQGLGQQGGVDVPEISGRDQVVVGQLGEAGLLAVEAAGHRLTRDEHRAGRAVVGAPARWNGG